MKILKVLIVLGLLFSDYIFADSLLANSSWRFNHIKHGRS